MNKDFYTEHTITELFENIVNRYPEGIAIIYENKKITYRELNNLSDRMATLIQQQYQTITNQAITPGTTIAAYVNRNIEMMVTILGILKACAAYVIISPEMPVESIRHVLNNSDSSILLECGSTVNLSQLSKLKANSEINIIHTYLDLLPTKDETVLIHKSKIMPNDLAYIMYTSGTTGNPKGVRVAHKSLAFFCMVYSEKMSINHGIVVDYVLSPAFTGSIPCYFPPLISGGTLLIQHSNILLNPRQYALTIQQYNATILKFTPTIFNLLFPYLLIVRLNQLKIILSGELLLVNQIKQYLINESWEIYNQYGFTECVAGFCSQKISLAEINSELVPVGVPYPGREMLLVDENLHPVLDREIGELLIGGLGLSDGYQKLPEETQKKFINISGKRYYRSGDLARVNRQGNLEILKRNDNQVKINGIRIEVSGIENKILEYSGIKNCLVVLTKPEGSNNEELVAYFSCINNNLISDTQIKDHLTKYLPSYMIPQFYMEVSQFPFNANGKVDFKKLLAENIVPIKKIPYLPINNELQLKLQSIWCEVLDIDAKNIGSNTDFFQLGGNSLKAYQVLIRLNEIYLVNFSIQDIFNYRTIELQEQFILKSSKNTGASKQTYMQYINEEF